MVWGVSTDRLISPFSYTGFNGPKRHFNQARVKKRVVTEKRLPLISPKSDK